MSCYIASNNNRFYVALEATYGATPMIGPENRFPGVKLSIKQEFEKPLRRDKTGTRTFLGLPPNTRRYTEFELRTYMTGLDPQSLETGYGALFKAALGGDTRLYAGGTAGVGSTGRTLVLSQPHGLEPGQAVTFGGEIRFVQAIVDDNTVLLNAAFTLTPSEGSPIGPAITYFPGPVLKSASIFDYWSPAEAIQRILCGAGIDKLDLRVNGDYHEFRFRGAAMDLIDNCSFTEGQGQLSNFPAEPTVNGYNYSLIPGHLGQAWLGAISEQFFTVTDARVSLDNNLELRAKEFGSALPRCLVAGRRTVTVDLSLYGSADTGSQSLYKAARDRSPIEVMLQLGQQSGQLCGVYLKSVIPEVPQYDDSETRLQWHFQGCRAQGTGDDEMVVAFG